MAVPVDLVRAVGLFNDHGTGSIRTADADIQIGVIGMTAGDRDRAVDLATLQLGPVLANLTF